MSLNYDHLIIYTEDTLTALNKTQIIELLLKLQEHTKGSNRSANV